MADRLTQLQDAVNVQAENLCNSMGLLQQSARPTTFSEFSTFSRSQSNAYKQVLAEAGIPIDNFEDYINNECNKSREASNDNVGCSGGNGPQQQQQPNGDANSSNTAAVTNGDGAMANNPVTVQEPGDNSRFFAKLITKTAKDIDLIIDSLPSREMEPELQEISIRRLETENCEEAKKLEDVINKAEQLLDVIKDALEDIAQNQMRMKQLEAQMLTSNVDDECPLT